MRGVQKQLTEVKLDHHILHVSDNRYIEKVFMNRLEGDQMLDQRADMEIIYVNNDESSDTSWRRLK